MKSHPAPCDPAGIERRVTHAVEKTVGQFQMLATGDAVLIGVSGGPDSMALLHLLHALAPAYSLRLAVAHLDHGLRPQAAEADARFVARAAQALGLACFVQRIDVGRYSRLWRQSPEEAGRRARYAFFSKTAAAHGFRRIAVGHHADDNAELVLMNLLRGSGPRGLAGIPPVRPLESASRRRPGATSEVTVIRPLLDLNRVEILAYLAGRSVPFREDASNADCRYLRNRVRRQLLPLLQEQYNPNLVAALGRLAAILRSEEDWAAERARELFTRLADCAETPGGVTLPLSALADMHPAAAGRLVRQALAAVKGDLRRISYDHVSAALALVSNVHTPARIDLPGGLQVSRARGLLHVSRSSTGPAPQDFCYTVQGPFRDGVALAIPETGDRLQFFETAPPGLLEIRRAGHLVAFFDMDKLFFPLIVRNARPGDRFAPFGLHGTQKVKKYFIDSGVPADRRRRCPLLISGEEIVWIAGRRRAEAARVAAATQRVLKAELFLA